MQSPLWKEIATERRAEGYAEGFLEGWRDALTIILTTRFGPLPTTIEAQIAAADLTTLRCWLTQSIFANSLDAGLASPTQQN